MTQQITAESAGEAAPSEDNKMIILNSCLWFLSLVACGLLWRTAEYIERERALLSRKVCAVESQDDAERYRKCFDNSARSLVDNMLASFGVEVKQKQSPVVKIGQKGDAR